MSVERQIQAVVARADMVVCAALRILAATLLSMLMLMAVLTARRLLTGGAERPMDTPEGQTVLEQSDESGGESHD